MNRRDVLRAIAALPWMAAGNLRQERKAMATSEETKANAPSGRMPVLYAAHGAPVLLDDEVWMGELAGWAKALPRPKSILSVSAHWMEKTATLGATEPWPLVYDFFGFPEKYYRLKYPSPGAPELAARVRELLKQKSIACADDPGRGLDHGTYVPLLGMYPSADIPVIQLSLPELVPERLVELGRALAPLRDEGVLLFASGFLTHNMRYAFRPGIPEWAREFDAWAESALTRLDLESLERFLERAPGARLAHPGWDHYAPLLVAAGAVADERPKTTFPITGWWMDSAFTKRSVQFG